MKTTIIQASLRGNKEETIPNQDSVLVFENNEYLIATVSDGVGSSKNASVGAKIACKTVVDEIQNFQFMSKLSLLNFAIKDKWMHEIREKSNIISDYQTTSLFIAVLKEDKKILLGQLGDGLISIRIDGLLPPIQINDKEFLNETECLGSNGNENYYLLILDFDQNYDFLIATDGISDELIPDKIEFLHDYFINKFKNIEKSKRNNVLESEINAFLNEKNNDDKSLIFTWSS